MTRDGVDISPRILVAILTLLLAVIILACLAYAASWTVKTVAVLVAVYITLSMFLHPRHSLVKDPFAIHNLSRLNVLIGCVFSCLYIASDQYRHNDPLLVLVLVITLVSVMIADVGTMVIGTAPTRERLGHTRSDVLAYRILFMLFAIGWLWRIYAFSQGLLQGTLLGTKIELTGASNVLGTLNSIAGTAAWGCVAFSRRPAHALPMVAAEILWMLVTGSKAATLYVMVPFMMVLYRREFVAINLRFVLGVGLLLAMFVSSFVVIHGYRVAIAKQIFEVGYAELNPARAVSEIELSGDDFAIVGQALTERLNFAERFLLILTEDERESRPPWLGSSYLMALAWSVPRAVWPEKPSMSLGRFFATEYLGWGEESRSEAGVTLWGEGFLNFGVVGAMLAPGLWMILLQGLYGFCLGLGRWGLFFVVAGYMLMVNSLSANISLPVASLSQLALVILVIRAMVAVGSTLTDRLEVRNHG